MRRWLQCVLAALAAFALLAGAILVAAVSLNVECNGPTSDCPRSAAYRAGVLAVPLVTLLILAGGGVWSIHRRRLRPLVLAEAAVLAVVALIDAVLNAPDLGTVVLLAAATAIGRAARRGPTGPPP